MFPGENKNCERRTVIKDFCFPNGIKFEKVSFDKVKQLLRTDKNYNKSSTFVFSLNGT